MFIHFYSFAIHFHRFFIGIRAMSTNSKSGELFLFSSDRRFIIKTLSSKEFLELLSLESRPIGFYIYIPVESFVNFFVGGTCFTCSFSWLLV